MRNTVQRQLVLHTVKRLHSHPTADDVYREIQKEHASISKATIYRNLHQLAEAGEVQPVLLPNSPERFDERLSQHYHFCCNQCGDVWDVDVEDVADINSRVASSYGFQVDGHDIVFKGVCPKCLKGL